MERSIAISSWKRVFLYEYDDEPISVEESMTPDLLLHLGGGALAGLAVGLAVKKALKICLTIIGLLLLLLYGLSQGGFIEVNWNALTQGMSDGANFISGWIELAVVDLSAQLVGFSGGVLLGLRWK